MIEELTKFWEREFVGFFPEANKLKLEYNHRWVRFHSLPDSKRYPENEQEYLQIIYRHNRVLSDLFGEGGNIFVVMPEYSETRLAHKLAARLKNLFPLTQPWRSLSQHEEHDDQEMYLHLHVAEAQIGASSLNSLFRLVANDEVSNIILINPDRSVVYHPYDGGADVILESTAQRNMLKEKFRDWLSSHPRGL